MLQQVQDEFNKHRDEFKKHQLRNANFKLEHTINRIDANVDKILDLLDHKNRNKAQRTTENMETEENPGLSVTFEEVYDHL
jgi:hypothetical protein